MSAEELWDHGDPAWELSYLAANEIGAYHAVRGMAGALGVVRQRRLNGRGQRTVTDILRPLKVNRDPLGNEADLELCISEKRWIPTNPNRPNGEAPIVVRHELIVMERIDDYVLPVAVHTRPKLHTRRPPGADLMVTLAKPAELLAPDMNPALVEQAEYLGYLEIGMTKLGLPSTT